MPVDRDCAAPNIFFLDPISMLPSHSVAFFVSGAVPVGGSCSSSSAAPYSGVPAGGSKSLPPDRATGAAEATRAHGKCSDNVSSGLCFCWHLALAIGTSL